MSSEIAGESSRAAITRARRIIVKVGTALLTGETTRVNQRFIARLCQGVNELWKQGRETAIVTSGAIGAGCGVLGYKEKPTSLSERQACAAAGQVELMKIYAQAFKRVKPARAVGQLLLTRDTLISRRRYLNSRNTMMTLFQRSAVPIVNENDTISVEEIRFGDNDNLSALVAGIAESDLLIILTDVGGLMDCDPRANPKAKLIPTVAELTPQIEAMARPTGSFLGTGGMVSKLQAARIAMASGFGLVLADGHDPEILLDIVAGKNVGTYFKPRAERISARKHWLAFTSHPKGAIVVDAGARAALKTGGKSLLPSGIVDVLGQFKANELVSLVCENAEFARGLSNFSSIDTHKIRGKKSAQIKGLLEADSTSGVESVHRDNLVIL
ncbi:MAG TPA: glutamate 5-kinase [Planctomycetota bacterium]|nr:glutamate 5-kinase [Planctomycetota bacterium]